MNRKTSDTEDISLRLKAIIDTAIDGIIVIDDKGSVESINRSAAVLFGYDSNEVIGHNIKMLMPQPYRSEHDQYINRYKKTKKAKIIGIGREVSGKKKDGTIFPFRLAVSEVILNDRLIFTGIVHDLTSIKKVEEELLIANETLEDEVDKRTQELEDVVNELLKTNRKLESSQNDLEHALDKERQLNELKSRFVSMASHEFRTPLSTIMSSASLIARYENTESQAKRIRHVEKIKSSVVNLTGILNDFLSLSKLEEGAVSVTNHNIDLEVLCEEVSQELSNLLKEGQKIEKHVIGPKRELYSDGRVLKNIFFNLISNATKYSGENTTITCEMTYMEDHLSIKIIDQGIGIPDNEQQYLFERFFRATNADNIQGTGLGLNIVKRYVSLLQGEISFVSLEGKGTTFEVIIPYLKKN